MILFLVFLVIALAIGAVYAVSNSGSHAVALWQWHWPSVPDWAPVLIAAALMLGLFLVYALLSGLVHGVRIGSMLRRASTRESLIRNLLSENERLRQENADLRNDFPVLAATEEPAILGAGRRPNPNLVAIASN